MSFDGWASVSREKIEIENLVSIDIHVTNSAANLWLKEDFALQHFFSVQQSQGSVS